MQREQTNGSKGGRVSRTFIKAIATLAMATAALANNAAETIARAAVEHAVEVRHVSGTAEYAYDSTGWRQLSAGKVLHPGAVIRTDRGSAVLVAMEEPGSFVRVSSSARLELTKAAPMSERAGARAAAKMTSVTKTMVAIR